MTGSAQRFWRGEAADGAVLLMPTKPVPEEAAQQSVSSNGAKPFQDALKRHGHEVLAFTTQR